MTSAELLSDFVRSHLYASAMILAVLAVRRPVRARVGARMAYALWVLPLIGAAAAWLPGRVERTLAAPAPLEMPQLEGVNLTAAVAQAAPQAVEAATFAVNFPQVVLGLWLAGVLASLGWVAVQQARLRSFARAGVIGPAVLGFMAPKVVLPVDFEERYDVAERALIVEHEVTHLRRQNPRVIAAAVTLRSLAWFNPLAYLAVRELRVDQELACDETVVFRFPEARHAYAKALAKSQLANRPLPLGCYWPSGTRHPLLERIAMLKTKPPGARRRLAGAIALSAVCAASGVAAWAANPVNLIYDEPAVAAPVVEVASAPEPAQAVATPVPAPRPAPQATREPAVAVPAPETVCLNNGCGESSAPKPLQVATCAPTPCRVDYIGSARVPNGVAFARYYDGNKPLLLRGRVMEVRMEDGVAAEIIVQHAEDGKRFRVVGGNPATLPAEARQAFDALPGAEVIVRAYQAFDTSCEGGGCVVNGRDVTFADGSKVVPGGMVASPPSQPLPTR